MLLRSVALPVLPGGTVLEHIELAPDLSAQVFAVRDHAEVTLEGTNDPATASVTVSQPTLFAGYSRELPVTTVGGARYTVTLVSQCTPGASVRLPEPAQ